MRPLRLVLALVLALALVPAVAAANPLIDQDLPDPSVIRDGDQYWMVATSRQWAPAFPLLRSRDMRRWRRAGAVLGRPPEWSDGALWAPSITRGGPGFQVFFSARRRGARHCIGMAEAPVPGGPWRDRGLVHCPPGGSIDPATVTDEGGGRWLVYKKMGVGSGIWLRRLTADGRRTVGRPRELLFPVAGWEQGTTEGPEIVRRDGRWWLLYSGGHCCRPPCTYSVGVAVSDRLAGPYVRVPRARLRDGSTLKCPGHGGLVDDPEGRLWYVHHAYRVEDIDNARRLPVSTSVSWPAGEPPTFGENGVPASALRPVAGAGFVERFDGTRLRAGWERPYSQAPSARVVGGVLRLRSTGEQALLGLQVGMDDWRATVRLRLRGCRAGLAAVQHANQLGLVGIEADERMVRAVGSSSAIPTVVRRKVPGRMATLRLEVHQAQVATAFIRQAGAFVPVGLPLAAELGQRFTRVGLTCSGGAGGYAEVLDVQVEPLG